MIRKAILSVMSAAAMTAAAEVPAYRVVTDNVPTASPGNIVRYAVTSSELNDEMIVDVWTPRDYDSSGAVRYPVVYAHDGQNLFDPKQSFAGVAWELDAVTQRLIDEGAAVAPIIVGIHNRGAKNLRASDYFPEHALKFIPEKDLGKTKIFETCNNNFLGDEHAAFVALSLKPLIDELYPTNPYYAHTMAMGSSMGALASLYLLCEYPHIFGAAAGLSTHWIGSLDLNADYTMNDDEVCGRAILNYLRSWAAGSASHRIYLDRGTTQWDANYAHYQDVADSYLAGCGYAESKGNYKSEVFDGAGHNEWYWQQRVHVPLAFLLKPELLLGVEDIAADSADPGDPDLYVGISGTVCRTPDRSTLPPGFYINQGRKLFLTR